MSLLNLSIQKMDCGIYATRHMKTYKGQRVKDWNCGLNSEKSLQDLRVKYCKVLLTNEDNPVRRENISRVEAWITGFTVSGMWTSGRQNECRSVWGFCMWWWWTPMLMTWWILVCNIWLWTWILIVCCYVLCNILYESYYNKLILLPGKF